MGTLVVHRPQTAASAASPEPGGGIRLTTRPANEIRARGVLECDDLTEAELLAGLSRGGRVALGLGLAVAVLAMIAQIAAMLRQEGLVADRLTSWVAAMVASIVVFGVSIVALRLVAARRRAHRVSGAEVEYVLRSDGLEVSDPWSRAQLPWSAFSGWNENERYFWLYQVSGFCRILPRRFLAPGDAERLRGWLRQILGEPGLPGTGREMPGALPERGRHAAAAPAGDTAEKTETDRETGPSIVCAGTPEWTDWAASRTASERLAARVYAGVPVVMAVVALALAALTAFAPLTGPELRRAAASWLPMAFVLAIMSALMLWQGRAERRAWSARRLAVSYRLTSRGLTLEHGDEVVKLAWSELGSWRETPRTFVFVLGGGRWYFLPLRFLDDGEQETLRRWLEISGGIHH